MPVYRICTVCGKKVLVGTLCSCEEKRKKENYKKYKKKRLQDKEEQLRQKFYSSNSWINLSENIKKHYFGLCLLCLNTGLQKESEYTHHIITIKERFDLRLCENNLIPLCDCCHKKVHQAINNKKDKVLIEKKLKDLIKEFNKKYY